MLPHLHYCILSWGSQCQEIYLLQKRAIRNIEKAPYRAHTEPIFKLLNVTKCDGHVLFGDIKVSLKTYQ